MIHFALNAPLARIAEEPGVDLVEAVKTIARTLDQQGLSAALMSEHPAPTSEWLRSDPAAHHSLDPFGGLAFLAAHSTTLKVFSNVIVLPFRNPFITAKAAATLQLLSGNRFILGAGVGYLKGEFDALGTPYAERGKLTDEAIETIRMAWSGESVVKQGLHFDAVGNECHPLPSVPPPIWVGGGSDSAVKRAARLGDGWLPYFTMPTNDPVVKRSAVVSMEHFSEKIARLHALRGEHGRSGPFDVVVAPPFRPKQHDAPSAAQFLDEAGDLIERGATWIWTSLPCPSLAGYLEFVNWFGSEVVAPFRARAE